MVSNAVVSLKSHIFNDPCLITSSYVLTVFMALEMVRVLYRILVQHHHVRRSGTVPTPELRQEYCLNADWNFPRRRLTGTSERASLQVHAIQMHV